MNGHIHLSVEKLLHKIKHLLITNFGKIEKEASQEEFYLAFSIALREEIAANWLATYKSFEKAKSKMVYYLSMEFLPGKFLQNNITNLKAKELVLAVLQKCDRSYSSLIASDPEPGLGHGGLGRLAACLLDSLATQQYPSMAYGLRYQYGIFEQELWKGEQIEKPDCWLLNEFPWEFRKDVLSNNVYFKGRLVPAQNRFGGEIFQLEEPEEVRALPYDMPIVGYSEKENYSVITLRLWSTKESPHNFQLQRYNAGLLGEASENTSLTDVLYPSDNNDVGKRIRLKQEFLLVSASLQDIMKYHLQVHQDIRLLPQKVKIQINDTHPAFTIAEMIRLLNKRYDIPFDEALEITQHCCNYTNHTILREALEDWNEKRVADLLPRQYRIIQKVDQKLCEKVRKEFKDEEKVKRLSIIENGQIRMAHLAVFGSAKVNGVATLHGEILKNSLFKDFFDLYPEKFIAITNGVTPRRWLLECNPELSNLLTAKIGKNWKIHFEDIRKIAQFATDQKTQEEFLKVKTSKKEALLEFLNKENPLRDRKGKVTAHSSTLDASALFDVQIKRFHEYKRQLLNALHLLMIYNDIKENSQTRKIKRQIIIAGKAAPSYRAAKDIIALFHVLAENINNDKQVSPFLRVAFVENYNVTKAEIIIPAADLSEQISTAGKEASGTGNMKMAMNGALTIGTEDGANIEMKQAITEKWWPFTFGAKSDQNRQLTESGEYKPWDVYHHNPKIKQAIDMLKSGALAQNEFEKNALNNIYEMLVDHFSKPGTDPFFVVNDLGSYYETQLKVEALYQEPLKWAEYALHNIAGMGNFSSDYVIDHYAKNIWQLEKCPLSHEILKEIQKEL
ncbi:MAG: glycogen/starch/alpha-glucan family phosphorylase [Parachlamydiales bacterium]